MWFTDRSSSTGRSLPVREERRADRVERLTSRYRGVVYDLLPSDD